MSKCVLYGQRNVDGAIDQWGRSNNTEKIAESNGYVVSYGNGEYYFSRYIKKGEKYYLPGSCVAWFAVGSKKKILENLKKGS